MKARHAVLEQEVASLDVVVSGPDQIVRFVCKLCHFEKVSKTYVLERPRKKEDENVLFLAAQCARCDLFQSVYDWQSAAAAQSAVPEFASPNREHNVHWDAPAELEAQVNKAQGFAGRLDGLGLLKGKRILDIGCGRGFFLQACRELGAATVTGQEFFRTEHVEYAINSLGVTDIRAAPFSDEDVWPDGEFDVVCSFDVLEHVHDLRGFFEACMRVAKPGAVLFHATPSFDSLPNRVGRLAATFRGRKLGASLCTLAPVDNFGGGAHVSILGTRPLSWLVSDLGMKLLDQYCVSSYTYSDQHYGRVVPGLRNLPSKLGARAFGVVRSTVRNKLVFIAQITDGNGRRG